MNHLIKYNYKKMLMLNKFVLLKSPSFLLTFLGCTWFQFKYLPSINFMFILTIAMIIDLITGIIKAWVKGENTTSQGLRQTLIKFIQYGGFILVGILLLNVSVGDKNLLKYSYVIDGSFVFILLIEFISICENLIEINPHSKIVLYVINPFMKLIKGRIGIKKNSEKK